MGTDECAGWATNEFAGWATNEFAAYGRNMLKHVGIGTQPVSNGFDGFATEFIRRRSHESMRGVGHE